MKLPVLAELRRPASRLSPLRSASEGRQPVPLVLITALVAPACLRSQVGRGRVS